MLTYTCFIHYTGIDLQTMRPLSESTARVAGKSFERKYISLGRIVKHWPEIVGAALAEKAQPIKIHYRKKEKQEKPDALLEIATSSADATIMHYQKDLILERINQIFGERWVSAIRFVNVPANPSGLKRKKIRQPLTNHKKKDLCDMLEIIEDAEIRARLERLGEAILTESP